VRQPPVWLTLRQFDARFFTNEQLARDESEKKQGENKPETGRKQA
jgi:hypothetical protein